MVEEVAAAPEDDEDMESEADEARTKLENFKYYTSLVLGTLCIVCIFCFLFLVPFVLDPAISTLLHRFVEAPVTCKVSSVNIFHGKTNCKWTSCREGCTSELYVCYQVIYYVYRVVLPGGWTTMNSRNPDTCYAYNVYLHRSGCTTAGRSGGTAPP